MTDVENSRAEGRESEHPPALVEAVARALCGADGYSPEEMRHALCGGELPIWVDWRVKATAALDARDAWMVENAPFDGGEVTNSRLRKIRKLAARPGATP